MIRNFGKRKINKKYEVHMLDWIDSIAYSMLIPISLIIGLAPFYPKPHLYEKLQMLRDGNLKKPLDIFDLLYHLTPLTILVFKVLRSIT
jgi:hypothetical protein